MLLIKKGNLKSDKLQVESDDEREARLDVVLSMQNKETDLIIDLFSVRHKKKSSTVKNSKNGRLPKKPKTPSKIIVK